MFKIGRLAVVASRDKARFHSAWDETQLSDLLIMGDRQQHRK
jgi:hypothetical protein